MRGAEVLDVDDVGPRLGQERLETPRELVGAADGRLEGLASKDGPSAAQDRLAAAERHDLGPLAEGSEVLDVATIALVSDGEHGDLVPPPELTDEVIGPDPDPRGNIG